MPRWPDDVDDAPGSSATRPGPARRSSPARPPGGAAATAAAAARRCRSARCSRSLVLVAALGVGGVLRGPRAAQDRPPPGRRARRSSTAWEKGDHAAMWRLLDANSRTDAFPARLHARLRPRRPRRDGQERRRRRRSRPSRTASPRAPVTVRTRYFGTLRGTIRFPVHEEGKIARIAWSPELRLPGLRAGRGGPPRAAARRRRAASSTTPAGGCWTPTRPARRSPASPGAKPTGLERIYDERLGGRAELDRCASATA